MEHDNEKHIQSGIQNAGDDQKEQRPFGIADSAQNGGAVVVEHKKRHSQKINPHIERGMFNNIVGRSHQLQGKPGENQPDKRHHNAAEERKQNRGMYGFRHFLRPAGGIVAGSQYIAAEGNANKQVGEHINKGGRGADGGERLASGKASHDHNIHRIKHKLQNAGKHQRQRKRNQLVHNGAAAHINFIFITLQNLHPLYSILILTPVIPDCCPFATGIITNM